MSTTDTPPAAAWTAAVRPAGPAPTTATWNGSVIAGLPQDHPVPDGHEARTLRGAAVDGEQAVEAHADAAEQAARPRPAPGGAPGAHARRGEGSGHALPVSGPHGAAGERDG